jgi:hypothetical protein
MNEHGIDGVIAQLDGIIAQQWEEASCLGYFPVLYRRVTVEIKNAIEAGVFDDAARMEWFDVVFANRYLEAFANLSRGQPTGRAWAIAFDAAIDWWPIVLQHLLLAINAHINLDLGIAAATTSPGDRIDDLEDDFDRINAILTGLVDDVERQLTVIWPKLASLGRVAGRKDDAVINFSITKARDYAWHGAKTLAPLDDRERQPIIDRIDLKAALVGRAIRHPGPAARLATAYVRLGERGTVRDKIDILMGELSGGAA